MSRDKAISFEAVKIAMRQTKDGYALTLLVHPNDAPTDLFMGPVGQRYVVALVAVDEHDQPIAPTPKAKPLDSPGSEAVKYAGMLCKEPLFWSYMNTKHRRGGDVIDSEEDTAEALRKTLLLTSRSQLLHDDIARGYFNDLAADYRKWAGID